MLEAVSPLGSIERHHSDQGERYGYPKKIRTVLAPFGLGPVGDDAHSGIGNRVIEFRYKQKKGRMLGFEPEHVRIEYGKIIGENLPEHRGTHIPEAVTYLFLEGRFRRCFD